MDWEDFTARELNEGTESANCVTNPFVGAAYVGWALGTTKADAGSAEAFKRADYDYCRAAAAVAKREPSVKHFALLSSAGASSSSWFLYMKTKGRVEDFVRGVGFDRVSVYRPGLLDRGDKTRLKEKIIGKLVNSTKASVVADLMASHLNEGGKKGVEVYDHF
jgi:oxidoreductase